MHGGYPGLPPDAPHPGAKAKDVLARGNDFEALAQHLGALSDGNRVKILVEHQRLDALRRRRVLHSMKVATDFESGQLGEHAWVAPGHLRATLYREWDAARGNTQATWYYFRLDGVRGVPLTIELAGLDDRYEGRPLHSIAERDKPFASADNRHWQRLPDALFDREHCTLTIRVTPETDTLWIAHLEPYTNADLAHLAGDYVGSDALDIGSAGRTVEGRDLPLWTISDPAVPDAEKRVVWLMARQHAWETHTSWCLEGLVRFLLGTDPEAAELRRRFLFRLLPMMDPDGVARGATRFNRHGYDPNRHWNAVEPEKMPEVFSAKAVIRTWRAAGGRIDLFLAFHDTQNDVLILAPPLVEHPLLRKLLALMRDAGFRGGVQNAGSINSSTVETALHHEFGILTGLVELGTVDATAADRIRFGAALARVLGQLL